MKTIYKGNVVDSTPYGIPTLASPNGEILIKNVNKIS